MKKLDDEITEEERQLVVRSYSTGDILSLENAINDKFRCESTQKFKEILAHVKKDDISIYDINKIGYNISSKKGFISQSTAKKLLERLEKDSKLSKILSDEKTKEKFDYCVRKYETYLNLKRRQDTEFTKEEKKHIRKIDTKLEGQIDFWLGNIRAICNGDTTLSHLKINVPILRKEPQRGLRSRYVDGAIEEYETLSKDYPEHCLIEDFSLTHDKSDVPIETIEIVETIEKSKEPDEKQDKKEIQKESTMPEL